MSYGDLQHSSPVYDDAAFQFKEYYSPPFQPASQDKYAVSESRLDLYGPHSYPQQPIPSRSNSTHSDVSNGHHQNGIHDQQYMQPHPHLHPHHALYATQPQPDPNNHKIHQHPQPQDLPQSWSPFDPSLVGFAQNMPVPYGSFPSPSPFPPPRLSPPPPSSQGSSVNGGPRLTLAGSLDPTTGIFYRTPEHPRLRTAQACEKCRTRKAKCSGEHPACKRCISRGLTCEYAKEGRVRGPNKPKIKTLNLAEESKLTPQARPRTSSTASSLVPTAAVNSLVNCGKRSLSSPHFIARRNSLSLGEHRSSKPRPPNLHLEASSNHFRLEGLRSSDPIHRSKQPGRQPSGEQPVFHHTLTRYPQKSELHEVGTDASMLGTSSTPTYNSLHLQPPGSMPGDYAQHEYSNQPYGDDSGSSSTSSHAASSHGQPLMLSKMTSVGFMQYRDEGNCLSDGGSQSGPQSAVSLTFNSSPTSAIGSPITPASTLLHYSRDGESLHHELEQQQLHTRTAMLPLDPIWADINPNVEFNGRPDEQNMASSNEPHGAALTEDNKVTSLLHYHPMDLQMC